MTATFDPYHQWLGIPPHEQPPNHYRLLGLQLGESDPNVIQSAADRQMAHVRSHQNGPYAELSQRLLNEIAPAKLCLLDPAKKAEYDAQLAAHPPAAGIAGNGLAAAPAPRSGQAAGIAAPPSTSTTTTARGSRTLLLVVAFAGLIGVGLLLAIGTAVYRYLSPDEPAVAELRSDRPATKDGGDEVGSQPSNVDTDSADASSGTRQPGERPAPIETDPPPTPDPLSLSTTRTPPVPVVDPAEPDDNPDASSAGGDTDTVTAEPIDDRNEELNDAVAVADPPQPAETTAVEARETTTPADKRLRIPDSETRRDHLDQIEELFSLSDARSVAQKRELARELLETALGTRDETDARFVLFNLTRKLASEAGDMKVAFAAVDELNKEFQIDADVVRVSSFDTASKAALPKGTRKTVVESGIQYVDDLLSRDQYLAAAKLISGLQRAARALRDRDLSTALARRRKLGSDLYREYQQAESAFATLQDDSDDPAANLTAGRFYCFAKGDWQRGLPLLAKGSDEQLKKLAELEMAAPASAADRQRLGDGWWQLAAAGTGRYADMQHARATMWYRKVIRTLSGLSKIRIQKRIDETADLEVDGGEPLSMQLVRNDPPATVPPPDPTPEPTDPAVTPSVEVAGGKDLPHGAVVRLGSRRFMHGGMFHHLSVSDDAQHAVTIGNGRIRKWNLRDGSQVETGHVNLPPYSRTAGNGKDLALIAARLQNGVDGQDFHIVNLATGKQVASFHFDGWSHSSAVSPDGRLVAIGDIDRFVSLVDPRKGNVLEEVPAQDDGDNRPNVSFSRSGSVLAIHYRNRLRFHRLMAGGKLGKGTLIDVDGLQKLTLSPEGDMAATAIHGSTVIHSTSKGAELATLPHPARTSMMASAFSLDGKLLAMFTTDYRLRIFDVASGVVVKEIPTAKRWAYIHALAFTRDGRRLLGASHVGRVLIWDLASGKEESFDPTRDLAGPVLAVGISPDGRAIASANSKGNVSLWRKATRWHVVALPSDGTGRGDPQPTPDFLRFIDGGKRVIAGSCYRRTSINTWDVASGQQTGHISGHVWPVVAVAVSQAAGLIASTSRDKSLRIWNSRGQQLQKVDDLGGGCVEFSADGKSVVIASLRGMRHQAVRIIDTTNGEIVKELVGHTGDVLDISFSPDGTHLVSSANDNTLRIWDVGTGRSEAVIDLGETVGGGARQVAYSPDGKMIASTGDDGHVYLWNAASGTQIAALSSHDGKVECLAWRQDGQQLVSGGSDASVLVWDLNKALE